jgi:putative PIN family toxin of toxin-antitoxin system
MKIFIDTNIFISAILFPNSKSSLAFTKALMYPFEPITSDYVIEELISKFNEKFDTHIKDLEDFLSVFISNITIIKTPALKLSKEAFIRDTKDMPILRAAIKANADYILTGDKDFLESGISKPMCISAADFLNIQIQ